MLDFLSSVVASLVAAAVFEILLLFLSRAHKPTAEPIVNRGLFVLKNIWIMTINGLRIFIYVLIMGIVLGLFLYFIDINKPNVLIALIGYIAFVLLTAVFPNAPFSKWFYGIYNEYFLGADCD